MASNRRDLLTSWFSYIFCLPKFEKGHRRVQLFNDLKQKVAVLAEENATTLLTTGGVIGVVGTAVVSFRAGFRSNERIRNEQKEILSQMGEDDPDRIPEHQPEDIILTSKAKAMVVWPEVIPPVVAGTATIVSIVMAHKMSAQKIAALTVAYGLAERNFSDYKDKVAEKLTGPKNQQVKDELAQEAVNNTPGSEKLVVIEGEVLCFDKATGRYFQSTMEQIRQAVNTTNAEIFNHGFTTVNFFYEELGLPPTTWAGEVGFDGENVLDLDYTTTMAPGNKPCLAIDFKSMPKTESSNPKYA